MFYTSGSIRLLTICLNYMFLIQQSNNRHEEKRSLLARYDASKDIYSTVRLMYERRKIVEMKSRYEKLSEWLVYRYNNKLMELNQENDKQLSKLLILKNIPA